MLAGPAYSAAGDPVSAKIPAPIMAPIPSVTRFTGPRARLRLCSPVSSASFISVSSDFVANKGLPMQLLLYGDLPLLPRPTANLARTYHCRGAKCRAPLNKYLGCASSYLRASCPKDVDRHAHHHDHQAWPGCLCLVKQQDKHNRHGSNDVEQRDKRIAKRFVRSLRAGPFSAQYENACNRQHVEDQHGKDNIVEQVAIKISVRHCSGRVHPPRAQQNQDDDPNPLIKQG